MTALYPLDAEGHPIGNYLLAMDADRPRFVPPHAPLPPSDEPVFLIIGAGFTGLSAALRLAELKSTATSRPILLLEQNRVASGPSGKSAGHICGLQAPDDAVLRHCGQAAGERVLAAAATAPSLIRTLIGRHAISCDLRDGYVVIHPDGRQTASADFNQFGIDPYPFALGLAHAAIRLGVDIREGIAVTNLRPTLTGYRVTTTHGEVTASHIVASGGHRMAEIIPPLASLRRRTGELRVSTIITAPLPATVLHQAIPSAASARLPFANTSADVAYGSIDRANRLIFGAHATAWADPDPARIMRTLTKLLPALPLAYREAIGQDLAWRPLVLAEKLCFTRDFLPNVGALEGHPNILYAHGLGGHGIAVGTLLGLAAAEKLNGNPTLFDTFAAVPHGWLPPWQPWRSIAAGLGLAARNRGANVRALP